MPSLLACLAIAILCAIPTGKAWSQVGSSRDSLVIDPSRDRVLELVVWNTGGTEFEASVRLQGHPELATRRGIVAASSACGRGVSVAPTSIRLGPGEQRTLRITIDSTATFESECWMAAVVQPTRIASRPLSTERTVPRRALIPLHVLPGTAIAVVPSREATPSRRAW